MRRLALLCSAALMLGGAAAKADLPPAPMPPDQIKVLARDVLQKMIETNTVHANGTLKLAEALAARFHDAGFAPEDVALLAPADHPTQGNVVVRIHGKGKGRPLLAIVHLDVVEAKPADWTVDPFQLTEKDGWFYGRGTLDIKGDAAALATTLIRMKSENFVPDRDIVVAFTSDEEGGDSNGVDWLLRTHRDLIDAELALNPDAGGGISKGDKRLYIGLQTSEKTYVTFRAEVTNKGGHSSLPEPDNAIYRLAAGLTRLSKLSFPVHTNATTKAWFGEMAKLESGQLRRDMASMSQPKPDPAAVKRLQGQMFYNAMLHTTCVATMLDGGHAENALPQRAGAAIQCRMMPEDSEATTKALIEKTFADPQIKVTVISPAKPGPESPLTAPVTAKMRQVVESMWPGLPMVPDMDAGASDSKYTRAVGIPTYGITGIFTDIDDNRAHGRDERIRVNDYYGDVEFTYRELKAFSAVE
jgi:acetylornithine deacetylase/succinyl-diaminopimelate desuccinylase-like protein